MYTISVTFLHFSMFNIFFWPMFIVVSVVAVLHSVAIDKAYYWTLPWYDIMMHFLGGVWLAFFIFWIHATKPLPFKLGVAQVLLFVIGVGLLWEAYELFFKMTFVGDPEYPFDTSLDLVMDTLGGVVAFVISKFLFVRGKTETSIDSSHV